MILVFLESLLHLPGIYFPLSIVMVLLLELDGTVTDIIASHLYAQQYLFG
jgi:hypothetical protein